MKLNFIKATKFHSYIKEFDEINLKIIFVNNQRTSSLLERATTPGSYLPSTSSRLAPPPVLTCESFSADPLIFLSKATVSPPPATEIEPSFVA